MKSTGTVRLGTPVVVSYTSIRMLNLHLSQILSFTPQSPSAIPLRLLQPLDPLPLPAFPSADARNCVHLNGLLVWWELRSAYGVEPERLPFRVIRRVLALRYVPRLLKLPFAHSILSQPLAETATAGDLPMATDSSNFKTSSDDFRRRQVQRCSLIVC